VQHDRPRLTTARHACRVFPKPGVAGSIPAGGTTIPTVASAPRAALMIRGTLMAWITPGFPARTTLRIPREERDIYFKHATLELHDAAHICKGAIGNGVSSTHEEVELLDPLTGPWCAVLLKRRLKPDR
jgi:hypothetical protein